MLDNRFNVYRLHKQCLKHIPVSAFSNTGLRFSALSFSCFQESMKLMTELVIQSVTVWFMEGNYRKSHLFPCCSTLCWKPLSCSTVWYLSDALTLHPYIKWFSIDNRVITVVGALMTDILYPYWNVPPIQAAHAASSRDVLGNCSKTEMTNKWTNK